MARIRDDHVKMIRNGKPKLIPMTTIETWIRDGHLEDSGWTFAPGAKVIYDEWIAEETRRRQRARKRPAVIQRDPGFADISRAVGQAAEADSMAGPIEPGVSAMPEAPAPDFVPVAPVEAKAPEAEGSAPAAETVEILED